MESRLEESQRWMTKAHSSLTAARKLWEESLFAESISRSYYAMFYAAKALLLLDDINVRLLLRAAMPLPQPTPEEAVLLVVGPLVNRTRSRKSRLKRQRATYNTNAPP